MDLQQLQQELDRIENLFENAKAEMHRYQGEYRAVQRLIEEKQDGSAVTDPLTIDAKPEKEKK